MFFKYPQPAGQRRRQRHRMPAFERFEERRVLTSYVLPTITTARPTVDVIGSITTANPSNSYQVDLASASVMQGNLSGMSANLDFSLKNSAGTEVAASHKSDRAIDSFVTAQLPSGRYTLQVSRVGAAQSRYRLTLSIAGGDDLLTGAIDLGAIGSPKPNQSISNSLTSGRDTQDYMRFRASSNLPIRIVLSGLTSDVNLQVLDIHGVLIAQGNAPQSALEDITITPSAGGQYYLRAWTNLSANSNYRLDISNDLPSDDLFVTPTAIGTLSSDHPTDFREGYLGRSELDFDTQDYFRFAITTASPVRINLRGHAVALSSVEVLDQLGRPVAFQRSFENQIYNLLQPTLSPGRYTIRISQDRHSSNAYDYVKYVLVIGTDIGSNDFPTNPTNLGTFSQTTMRTVRLVDSVGDGVDKMDHYRFTLLEPTQFSYSETVERSDLEVNIFLFGADNSSMWIKTIYQRMMSATFLITLPAGNYLVWARPAYRGVPSSYILTLSTGAESDDVQGRGQSVGTLVPEQRPTVVTHDSVGGLDIQDFYTFSLLTPNHAFVTLSNMTSNLGIEVLDRWGRSRGTRSNNTGTSLETIALNNLPIDIYYVRIYPEPGAQPSNYDLMISLSGGDDLISGAATLGILDANTRPSVSFSGTVGGATDIQDHYRMTLAQSATLRINLTGQTSVFQIQILSVDGALIAEGRTSSTADDLVVTLPADDYVLRITSVYAIRQYQLVARVT